MSFFAELQKRGVLRAAGGYIALSWLVVQVADTLLEAFGLDANVLRSLVIALCIGFLPAVIAAWVFELTPAGIVREGVVDHESSAARSLGRRLDRLVMLLLALAVAYFAVDKFLLEAPGSRAPGAPSSAATRVGPAALAILPFTAVGDSEDSRFFAAGVHDDLLTRMAQQDFLRVLSRTSVMAYKDTVRNLRAIGEELGADIILEGGVQAAGNRIRINAQLIDASTDEHLWAETYDRELTTASIFDVQSDIAAAIAASLQSTLQQEADDGNLLPTENMAAYRAFHEAMRLRDDEHGWTRNPVYRDLLRQALQLDPGFLRPAAELVGVLSFDVFHGQDDADTIAEIEGLIDTIQQRAPGSVEAEVARAYYTYYVLKDYRLAHAVVSRAHALAPSDMRVLTLKGWIERRLGDVAAKLETDRLRLRLEPGDDDAFAAVIGDLVQLHRYDEAAEALARRDQIPPFVRYAAVMLAMREHGDPVRLADEIAALAEEYPQALAPEMVATHRIASREYDVAAAILEGITTAAYPAQFHFGINSKLMAQINLRWAMQQPERLAPLLEEARGELEGPGRDAPSAALGAGLVAAASGDREEAERSVRRWFREAEADPAMRGGAFETACDVLAMADAVDATVACLRRGLEIPSYVSPFYTPAGPFYDPVRESPAFEALMAEWSGPPGPGPATP